MNVASKISAYGAAPELRRPNAGRTARFGSSDPATATRSGSDVMAAAPPSPHAQRSAAQTVLLQAQSGAKPALEHMPPVLRARAAAAALTIHESGALDAAAEATLNRLRDDHAGRKLPHAEPLPEAARRKGAAAYRDASQLRR